MQRWRTTSVAEHPPLISFNHRVVPWDEARLHVWSEYAIRGASVFEGIRAYWQPVVEAYACLALQEHIARLYRSAQLLRMPLDVAPEQVIDDIAVLLEALDLRQHAYIRPTLYVDEDRPAGSVGVYVGAFPMPHAEQCWMGIRACVSSWRRAGDDVAPPRIKWGAGYGILRLARNEAVSGGYDEAFLLNDRGHLTEATGAAVFIVRDGVAATPPLSAGILESITRTRVLELLQTELGVPVEVRDVQRSELHIADEVFTCGTLREIVPVTHVDAWTIGDGQTGPITARLRDRYFAICDRAETAPHGWMTTMRQRRGVA